MQSLARFTPVLSFVLLLASGHAPAQDHAGRHRNGIHNPAPILSSIKPTSTNAGGPAFTLTATGSAFASISTIHWNGIAYATTFVSATKLTATVPAGLIASPGTAAITVVTPSPGGGTSGSKSFKILLTVNPIGAVLTLNPDGSYTATVSLKNVSYNTALKNVGYNTARSVTIKKASLGGAATTSTLPMSVGSIAPEATSDATLNFPATVGASGSMVKLVVSGAFSGGKFAGSLKVTLP